MGPGTYSLNTFPDSQERHTNIKPTVATIRRFVWGDSHISNVGIILSERRNVILNHAVLRAAAGWRGAIMDLGAHRVDCGGRSSSLLCVAFVLRHQ